ncbi:MAG: Rieske 2Fe-2S domain-containing protein [Acidimicrobiales bacterium]
MEADGTPPQEEEAGPGVEVESGEPASDPEPGSDSDTDAGARADDPERHEPPAAGEERPVAVALVISTVAALGLAAVYIGGGQAQAEGALLLVALGGIGIALALWAKRLLPEGEVTEDRGDLPSTADERDRVEEATAGSEDQAWLSRRKLLLRLLGGAAGALGLAALFPIRSLGPSPGTSLERTAWRRGLRLIDPEGRPVRLDTLQVGSILTVFPEGREQAGDSQAVLVRVEPGQIRPRKGRESWSPDGYVAYSKICPHVGCPVGLYQQDTHELICPCHQSTFDVLDGARPTFGPATRSLPQLPLRLNPEGFLVADGDFPEPVGPGYWNRE